MALLTTDGKGMICQQENLKPAVAITVMGSREARLPWRMAVEAVWY